MTSRGAEEWTQSELTVWFPIAAGFVVLYVPTLFDLFRGLWSSEEQAHGPIVLGIAGWLFYRNWPVMRRACEGAAPSPSAGWPLLLVGLVLYALGRSQGILLFEIGSAIWLFAASLLLVRGKRALKALWFPLFFMLFMIPLPGSVVDALTMPMKTTVSFIAEHLLSWVGYPIARIGVILQIGKYQLLVADACAGLHTILTLEALGLLYLNLVRHDSLFRNITLTLLIVPISIAANVIRVMALTLITFHFGDAAGQGFLHGFAGVILFGTALLLIIGIDSALQYVDAQRRRTPLPEAA
jgi:exosortase B